MRLPIGDWGPVLAYAAVAQCDLDIAIAPLEPSSFNECKSYLKLLEYGLQGLPVVASRFGPYVQYQAEAKEAVVSLAQGPEDWTRQLLDLVDSATARASLARANLRYIFDSHTMSKRVIAWEDAFDASIRELASLPG